MQVVTRLPSSFAPRAFSKFCRRHCLQEYKSTTASRSLYSSNQSFSSSTITPKHSAVPLHSHRRNFSTTMSFSNTDTPHADPYKEKNKDEPGLQEKIEDLVAFTKSCKFGMMTTRVGDSGLLVSRCMAVAGSEAGGVDLVFHTNTESGKTDDLEKDNHINMAFLNGTGEWASISGVASVITDRSMVKKYYSEELKAWLGDLGDGKHDGSENDPRIGVIKIEAKTATYALSRGNMISRGIEMIQGALTGNAAQVNKLREISEQEISQWRSSH